MPHPFQIQASSKSSQHVDEIMFAWNRIPAGSTASIYLPGVTAAEILALADTLYPSHTLSAEDPYTITTPTGPVTFVPIPRTTGLLAGLLTVDLPMGIRRGDLYTVVVRQLTNSSELVRTSSPTGNPSGENIAVTPARKFSKRAKGPTLVNWRRVLGAFQINLRISTKQNLLAPEEHRLSLFRWIAENVLPQSRWYPVMQRYITQLAGRVSGFGGNPGTIIPSQSGNIPGQPAGGAKEHHKRHEVTGKVASVVYDHFGDFEGFTLETDHGEIRHFHNREVHVLNIVRVAMGERNWVTVVQEPHRRDEVLSIIVRVPPPWHY